MTVWAWLAAMQRRWPVLVVGLLCTICAVYAVHKRHISFQACGSVVVGAPKSPISPNVYNNTQGSLVAATGLITDELQSSAVRQQLWAEGATAAYQAQVHNTGTTETPAYGEPEMDVCASSREPEVSLRTANAVLAEFGTLLRERELAAHVAPKDFLTDGVLASPGLVAETGRSSQAYLGVGVLGLIATAATALWADRYLRHLRWRRRARKYAVRRAAAAAPTGHSRGVS